MIRPSLVNLETLLWIARLGTFTAAAERLNTTQPAISARVRELEAGLGISLFVRQGRRMHLTPEARSLINRLEPIILELEEEMSRLDDMSDTTGTVRIGVGAITMTWFAGFLADLHTSLPRVTIELEIGLAGPLQRQVEDGNLDIAVIAGNVRSPLLVSTPIGKTHSQWYMSTQRDLPNGAQSTPQEIVAAGPIWSVPRSSAFFSEADRLMRTAGARSSGIHTCNDLSKLVDLVVTGKGLAIIPKPLAKGALEAGTLVSLPMPMTFADLPFTVVRHKIQSQHLIQWISHQVDLASPLDR